MSDRTFASESAAFTRTTDVDVLGVAQAGEHPSPPLHPVLRGVRAVAVDVGARGDDARDLAPETLADVATRDVGVFDDVVQQRRDRLTLAPAVLEHERRHCEEVRDVGDVAALPGLAAMVLGRVLQRSREFIAALRAFTMLRSCSASVDAKYVFPFLSAT